MSFFSRRNTPNSRSTADLDGADPPSEFVFGSQASINSATGWARGDSSYSTVIPGSPLEEDLKMYFHIGYLSPVDEPRLGRQSSSSEGWSDDTVAPSVSDHVRQPNVISTMLRAAADYVEVSDFNQLLLIFLLILGIFSNIFSLYPGVLSDRSISVVSTPQPVMGDPTFAKEMKEFEKEKARMEKERLEWKKEERILSKQKAEEERLERQREKMRKEKEKWEKEKKDMEAKRARLKQKEDAKKNQGADAESKSNASGKTDGANSKDGKKKSKA